MKRHRQPVEPLVYSASRPSNALHIFKSIYIVVVVVGSYSKNNEIWRKRKLRIRCGYRRDLGREPSPSSDSRNQGSRCRWRRRVWWRRRSRFRRCRVRRRRRRKSAAPEAESASFVLDSIKALLSRSWVKESNWMWWLCSTSVFWDYFWTPFCRKRKLIAH